MYLMVGTRPEIAFTVCQLSKHVERQSMGHWKAGKRLMRYVIHTIELGLCYNGAFGMEILEIYVDADWASDCANRKPKIGCIIMTSGAAVPWYSCL